MISLKLSHLSVIMQRMMLFSVTWAIELVAAHLRKFLKECDSYACTILQGKRLYLRTQFPGVNVTFAHSHQIFSLIYKW